MKKELLRGAGYVAAAGLTAGLVVASSHGGRSSKTASVTPPADVPSIPAVTNGGVAGVIGPDVVVGSMNGTYRWTTDTSRVAYSFGTTSCNIGDEPLDWNDNGGAIDYPVIGQNMYRLDANGRFMQIGMGWLKHGFCALQNGNLCGEEPCDPVCGGCCDELGPGCSDPYGAGLNGSQSGLGPRFQVNAYTGYHPDLIDQNDTVFPDDPIQDVQSTFDRRVIVEIADIDPAQNPGALYFIEGQYVARDDAVAVNHYNNSSHRRVVVQPDPFMLNFAAGTGTQQQEPAINAWKVHDPDNSVVLNEIGPDVTNEGLFILGYDVIEEVPGQLWRYEYALYNHNSHRSAGSFTIPVGANAQITDIGFHDIEYHSGEMQECGDPTGVACDWDVAEGGGVVSWSVKPTESDINANALRWGTMYNFWFTANTPPEPTTAEISFFQASDPPIKGEAASFLANAVAPEAGVETPCPWDSDDNGEVDVADLVALILAWGSDNEDFDYDDSGEVDTSDLVALIINWGPCE